MRWLIFFIFAYLMLGAQTGVGDQLRIHGASANLVLLAVTFICLNTSREASLTAALLLGLLQDLLTLQPPGLFAFAYGLVGLVCTSSNRVVYPDHPLTHVFFAFVGQLVVSAVVLGHSFLRPPAGADGSHLALMPLLWTCVYTAAVAPIVLGLLTRVKPVFGFDPVRRRPRAYN